MKLENIISYIEEIAPLYLQESYDNSGLILGEKSSEVSGVLVCLDADDKALEYAIEQNCQMVLSHHPVVFSGIKTFANGNYEGDTVLKAIRKGLALYSCHTNFDSAKGGLSDLICARLGINNTKVLIKSGDGSCGAGRYGEIEPESGEKFINTLKSKLSLGVIRCVGDTPDIISKVAVYNGSYDDEILDILVDLNPIALVTGDVKYHAAQELLHKGIFTIDAGHYGTEKLFVEEMSKLLEKRFPDLKVIRFEGSDVFSYC